MGQRTSMAPAPTDWAAAEVMIRVLTTSAGVVAMAASPPAQHNNMNMECTVCNHSAQCPQQCMGMREEQEGAACLPTRR